MAKAKARKKPEPGGMSEWEEQWSKDFCNALYTELRYNPDPAIKEFEPMTFHLGERISYKPDFMHIEAETGTIIFVEVKGSRFQRGYQTTLNKVKWASQKFPQFVWIMAVWNREEDKWDLREL